MALFKRSDDLQSLLKKVDSRGWKTPAEKRELLEALEQAGELRSADYIRFVTGSDAEISRWAMKQVGTRSNPRLLDQFLAALPRTPQPRWKPLIMTIVRMPAGDLQGRLRTMLRHKQVEQRLAAIEVLAGHPRPREMMALLRQALDDSEEGIRVRAVQTLGQDTNAADVRQLLRELFEHSDPQVRQAAIEALAVDPDPTLIEPFFELLPDQPSRTQDLIIRNLRQMLRSQSKYNDTVLECVLPVLSADDKKLRNAAAQLLTAMPDKLRVLRRFLQYAKGLAFWLRDRAFGAVSTVADDITEAVLTLMQDEDVDVVVGAVFMAKESRDPRLLDGLHLILSSEWEWWVKIPALEMLSQFEEPGVTKTVVFWLKDEDLRTCALVALGRRAESDTMQHILPFLEHEYRGLRKTALQALENFREPILIPVLEQVVRQETEADCRFMALELLDNLGAEGVAAGASLRTELRIVTGEEDGNEQTVLKLDMVRPDLNQ